MSAGASIPLERIMPPRLGSVDPSAFPNEAFDLYSIPAFDQREPEVLEGSAIGSVKQIVQPGDVLLSRIVPHIRRAWVVGRGRGRRIIASGEWIVFRGAAVEPRYLRHVLVSDPFHAEFMSTVSGVGGSLLRARPAYVAKIKIPLPPLPKQRRIAEILDKADALRAKRRAALAQLDTLTQSIFLDMFGDPATNPKRWAVRTVGDMLDSAAYGTSEKSAATGMTPVLRMSNITSTGRIDLADLKFMDLSEREHERYTVRLGDVLFNRTNSAELVGKTAIFRETRSMAFAGYLIRLRVTGNNHPEYLAGFMNTRYAKRVLRGMCKSIIGMANINATEVQAMRIAFPPLALQRQFADRVALVEISRVAQLAGLAELESLFSSVQHRAFRGEL